MSYSFLRESKLYIEYGGNKYRIYTTAAISFTQTFAEDSYPVKTLHDQSKMFEGTTITKANPAQFSFTVPLTVEKDESIVMDLITDLVSTSDSDIETQQLKNFNMFVQTGSSTFKMETCAITTANFSFNPREQFVVSVEGQGSKLTRVGDESYNLGTIQSESSTRTPLLTYPVVTVDSLDMSSILGVTLQIQNDIHEYHFVFVVLLLRYYSYLKNLLLQLDMLKEGFLWKIQIESFRGYNSHHLLLSI